VAGLEALGTNGTGIVRDKLVTYLLAGFTIVHR